ncbi:phosphate signaling complex protein PhoU [Methylobrevis pamukkalensis]|uniref:Phosphate-specific transport system accessory protein PhoU n=1 Tax=Methylobrevis pamukkalensis TaxID=1439726 RepID=A0A1E3H209_9HYPH|nr:phosphate signaling complex protein PhoU [Methylobrevis pamukkalensis]ODN69826.1 Phosphate-specific transport system accessory protein PhoU [Methylobrevis pamukkalensis]
MSEHTVSAYEEELRVLAGKIAEMGGLAEILVADAVKALTRGDLALAKRVIPEDRRLDQMQREIEDAAILVIARRQPMASDLREVVSFLRIANDLERIGDLAKNIAKRVIAIDGQMISKKLTVGLDHMAEIALQQLNSVLDAYGNKDDALALEVRLGDDEIDALYTSLFRELLTYMMEDPRNISQCTHLLFCAKNLERIGDHATNVAETVHYVITGEMMDPDRPKADTTSLERVALPG